MHPCIPTCIYTSTDMSDTDLMDPGYLELPACHLAMVPHLSHVPTTAACHQHARRHVQTLGHTPRAPRCQPGNPQATRSCSAPPATVHPTVPHPHTSCVKRHAPPLGTSPATSHTSPVSPRPSSLHPLCNQQLSSISLWQYPLLVWGASLCPQNLRKDVGEPTPMCSMLDTSQASPSHPTPLPLSSLALVLSLTIWGT